VLGPEDVFNAAATLLHYVEDAAVSFGIRLPNRRTLTTGGAVYDCEMVTISSTQVTLGLPSGNDGRLVPCGPSSWTLQAQIAIVRCAAERPQGLRGEGPPRASDLIRDAAMTSKDCAVLAEAVGRYADLTNDATLSLATGSTQGGLIATVATVAVPLWTHAPAVELSPAFDFSRQ
jgi:hypothetical protein